MHELSIAQHIGEIVIAEAKQKNAIAISSVLLEIGELSGVELDALEFAWKSIQMDEFLASASLSIDQIPGRALCKKCNKKFDLHDFFDVCPICEGFETEVIQGKELRIKSIDIEC